MKFGFSVQPAQKEYKSIVPSHLLSDPAFSPDLRCNPYSDTNKHFAWDSPPQGHPILKGRHRLPPLSNFERCNGIHTSADWHLEPVQPPNSPVSHIDGGSGIHHQDTSLSFTQPTLNTAAPSAQTSCSTAVASTAPPLQPRPERRNAFSFLTRHPQPSALTQGRKKRMHFLSRRKTIQTSPSSTNVSTLAKTALLPEHTISRASSSRSISQSVASAPRDRPILPPRAASSGTSTPRSALTALSKRPVESRNNDLDRIDELDETSPLGLSLHHDGPYEVASQAIKRGADSISLGTTLTQDTSSAHMYGMQAYGKPYVPPQAPFGVSLNLSPGQILPRNFGEPRVNAPPPRMRDNRENAVRPPRMQHAHSPLHPSISRSHSQLSSPTSSKPPRHMYRTDERPDNQSDFSWNRRQSRPPPSPFSPLPNPHPVQPELAAISRTDFSPQYLQSQVSLDSAHSHLIASNYSSDTSSLYQSSLDSRRSFSSSNNSRRHSQHLPRTIIVSSNPSSDSSHRTTSSTRSQKIESLSVPSLVEPPGQEEPHAAPIDIGMAMLHSQQEAEPALVIPAPRIYLPHGTPESENEFNPYDPIHLENEHDRTPSPPALAYDNASHHSCEQLSREPSRRPSPVWPLDVQPQAPARPPRAPERPVKEKENIPLLVRNPTDPPPYTFAPSDGIDIQVHEKLEHEELSRRPTHFRVGAEGGPSSPLVPIPGLQQTISPHSHVGSGEGVPLPRSEVMAAPAPVPLPVVPVQSVQHRIADRSASLPSLHSERQLQSSIGANDAQSQIQNVHRLPPAVNQAPTFNPGATNVSGDQHVIPMLPARRSRERLVPLQASILSGYEPDRDARSTHQSFSTGSSGHPRTGPPPRRHVPKHLVMPAPLNTNNVENTHAPAPIVQHNIPQPHSLPTYIPPRQIPPRRAAQVSFKPQAQVYYPPPSSSPLSVVHNVHPVVDTKPPALEAHIQTGRKLKKRVSIVPPTSVQIPPPPARIATVSFAPPVVGYDSSSAFSKPGSLSRSKTEKSPKKVLSKRRTDL